MKFSDDKPLAIVALSLIAIFTAWKWGVDAKEVVIGVISGLAGFVTGKTGEDKENG